MKVTITLFLVLLSTSLFQAQVNVTGRVNDSTGTSVEFATVVIKKGDHVIGNAFTNERGDYVIHIPEKGKFALSVYYIGFNTKETEINLVKDSAINITLSSNKFKLKEVVVTGKNLVVEQKVDRLVFNVGNSIAATGGDALDALKVTPGIMVKNDIVSMVGKNGLRVMINDKIIQLSGDALTNFLKSIAVADISKIEVISNPAAKYEAEGNSGLVNIQLKGANRDVWSSAINASYVKNTYSTGRGGGNFNYQKNKISIYSNIGVSNGSRQIIDQSKMYYPDQLWSNKSPRKVTTEGVHGSVGLNYAVSPKWEIGTQYMGSVTSYMINNNSVTTLYKNNGLVVDSILNTISQTKEHSQDHSFNIHSTVNLDTLGKKIIFNVDYFIYKDANDGSFHNTNFYPDETKIIAGSYYSAHNTNNQQTSNYSAKVDVEYPLKWINLSYGGKVSSTTTNNDIAFYTTTSGASIIDLNRTNTFAYNEHNQALYVSGNKKMGNKWEIQLGVRGEGTQTKGNSHTLNQTNTYSYLKIFPTAYLSYTANDNNAFYLNYGRRINRPNYEQLNPFRMYASPYLYVEGNPFLQPSFSDNIELSHTHKNVSSKLYYSSITNGFQQLPMVEPNSNIQRILVQNFYNTHTVGLTESFMFNKFECWESNNSFDIYYSKSNSTLPITRKSLESFNAYLSTSNDFRLNTLKTIFFNISYWYNFPGNSDLMKNSAYSQLDVALKMLLLKKKLTLAVSGQDIISTNRPLYTMYSNVIKIEYKNYYDNRCVRVSLVYKFGNNKIKSTEKDFGNADEKGRTGK